MAYIQLEPVDKGVLSKLSDFLFWRWMCCSCWDCDCCQLSEEEVEILGPFPAPTPSWLVNDCHDIANYRSVRDVDGKDVATQFPATFDRRGPETSEVPCSTSSLSHRLSNLEAGRPSSPQLDMKLIELWALGSRKEAVQPSVLHRPHALVNDCFQKLEPQLYSAGSRDGAGRSADDDMEVLTDEEVLLRYQLGRLHFGAQYDLLHNRLSVRIIEARDLPPPRQDTTHCNPYVKTCLLPDHKNSRQTGVQRKTQDPIFEESFMFELPFLEAQRRTLLLSVVDFDKLSRHCVIGKVAVPLREMDLVKGGHWWKPLVPSSQDEVELGELLLSLNYLPSAGRLNVDIVRAKQLLQTDMCQGSDPFVKVQLVMGLKLSKSKKTSCKRGTIDPVYSESFSFRVAEEDLGEVSLVFTVYGHKVKSSNDFVGRIVIGHFSTGAPETSHWHRMLHSPRTPVEQWHSLRSRADCDRVSLASLEVT